MSNGLTNDQMTVAHLGAIDLVVNALVRTLAKHHPNLPAELKAAVEATIAALPPPSAHMQGIRPELEAQARSMANVGSLT